MQFGFAGPLVVMFVEVETGKGATPWSCVHSLLRPWQKRAVKERAKRKSHQFSRAMRVLWSAHSEPHYVCVLCQCPPSRQVNAG
jgi:hypothetical protein